MKDRTSSPTNDLDAADFRRRAAAWLMARWSGCHSGADEEALAGLLLEVENEGVAIGLRLRASQGRDLEYFNLGARAEANVLLAFAEDRARQRDTSVEWRCAAERIADDIRERIRSIGDGVRVGSPEAAPVEITPDPTNFATVRTVARPILLSESAAGREALGLLSDLDALTTRVRAFLDREVVR